MSFNASKPAPSVLAAAASPAAEPIVHVWKVRSFPADVALAPISSNIDLKFGRPGSYSTLGYSVHVTSQGPAGDLEARNAILREDLDGMLAHLDSVAPRLNALRASIGMYDAWGPTLQPQPVAAPPASTPYNNFAPINEVPFDQLPINMKNGVPSTCSVCGGAQRCIPNGNVVCIQGHGF